jgi:hypothetical protein
MCGILKRRTFCALVVCGMAMPCAAELNIDAYRGCTSLADSGRGGRLVKLSDREVERALCLATKAVVEAISSRDNNSQRACLAASEELAREFRRRWPSRDLKETAGRC